MAPKSAPLVSLQAPKDVSLNEIEQELNQIWQGYREVGGDNSGMVATRATTFTLVVYEPEETQRLLAMMGFYTGPVDGIDGPRTEAAIRVAQAAYGLEVNGYSSPELLAKLREDLAKRKGEIPTQNSEAPRYVSDAAGSGIADVVASQNPCRIISLFPFAGEDEGVSAQVSAYCPINKANQAALVCCEYVSLKGTEAALNRASDLATSLLISELPRIVWWKGAPHLDQPLFQRLSKLSNQIIFDSSRFAADAEAELLKLANLREEGVFVTDLNWRRLAAWQELAAEAFDAPERRDAIWEVDQVVIDYEKGNSAQALMYLGWLASRLEWEPVSREKENDIYDLQRVFFMAANGRKIEAELAGIPTADVGEVKGDMVSLKLSSTNLRADCCTVLCSQTTGCMRMEAGGGAQACRINQVTPLNDQKAETLLSEQLQRVGQDVLYEESMAVTAKIIQL
ncbi:MULTISPECIES: glucose-6-phosphate dehydrogenase assembly protein OpcA [Leptolyngbya]|jgi:glucose-6-phosphate dehydrogenase assembly protein OpcA|uniref:OpcA protein n=2 Tax=Leptolyngbya boryana TaxID=1184 RepID=A0A1Z4JGU2_LEPBY|nr:MULTISPECIES: glucose-6-phosphate dehydrogenase assembly protein OpcA [Leptolyngbya]BAY55737.1 OpcA protein [Leptolyngbya boryana NIES-2135]MBD1856922.1 glucose-6-phosphate dehydrogenase assembly protein OpcA [Leptolyngbya sp. FACHB-1624]MBD2370369.1 glucose-6-phosphate dehydrogenase assembly protein OpcA [Leptolyngbya sp. FACHB-161]MBD2376713.1 glucose-6-phosphate dehydrogenase assembly protein OpcA [Leptolyngbya sp. FACHB-238]MBD2400983.1 glucose-6-phosphate dehydrogenase assembly protein